MPAPPAYAAQADFEAFVEGWVTDDPAALGRLLARASEDLDAVLGDYDLNESGTFVGLKIDMADLDFDEDRALTRATCAQAWYRHEMGEDFFVAPKFRSTSGPEFGTEGTAPHVGPLAMRELAGSGLLRNTSSLNDGDRLPSWFGFAYNVDED